MAQNAPLDYEDQAPEEFFDATQEMLSGYSNVAVVVVNPTTIRVPAGPGDQQVSVSIGGAYRYVTANVDRAHPGGAAGTYDVFVTALANQAKPSYGPAGGDHTFALAILASGSTPGSGIYRRIRTLQWDGAAITRVDRLDLERPLSHAAAHAVGGADPVTPAAIGAAPSAAPTFTGGITLASGSISIPAGSGLVSGGVLYLDSGSANDQTIFRGSGAVERARLNGGGDLVFVPGRSIGWGSGGSLDTYLQRQSSGVVYTPGAFTAASTLTGGSLVTGGTLTVNGASTLTGAVTVGTNVAMSGSGAFIQRNAAAANTAIFVGRVAGDGYDRIGILADGTMAWGPGNAGNGDVQVNRSAAGVLYCNANALFNGQVQSNQDIFARYNDGTYRLRAGVISGKGTGIALGTSEAVQLWNGGGSLNTNVTMYATSYQSTSDRRLKTDVADIDPEVALSAVRAMKPVRFRYLDDGYAAAPHTGLIAQDVREVYADAVGSAVGDHGEHLTLDYTAVHTLNVAATRALADRLEALEARVAEAAR